jgi:uncharacterized membrane protein
MTTQRKRSSQRANLLLRFASHTKLTATLYLLDFVICTFGYMLIEKASLGDALWWCTVTWFTVGYGDSVPLTGWGRVFGIYAIVSSHILIVLVTANFVAKLSQYRSDAIAASRAEEITEDKFSIL